MLCIAGSPQQQRSKQGCEYFLVGSPGQHATDRDERPVTEQTLVPTLVRDHCLQAEVVGIAIPFKRLRLHDQRVGVNDWSEPELCAAGLTVHVTILDLPPKSQGTGNAQDPLSAGRCFLSFDWFWSMTRHAYSIHNPACRRKLGRLLRLDGTSCLARGRSVTIGLPMRPRTSAPNDQ